MSQIDTQRYTHFYIHIFFLSHRLSFSHTHTHTHTHTLVFPHTHTHAHAALLSVMEFYILMKEEARWPIRAAAAGRDHVGADSGVVRKRFDRSSSGSARPAPARGVPSSAGVWWYDPPGSIRTPPLRLPLSCQCWGVAADPTAERGRGRRDIRCHRSATPVEAALPRQPGVAAR